MKVNANITSNRELKIYVDLSEENDDATAANPNAWVSSIEIFNTQSYLDDDVIYTKEFKDYNVTGDTNPVFENPFVITEHDLNLFDTLVNSENGHQTDMFNDIIIANVNFGYKPAYEATYDCSSVVHSKIVSIYYPCPLYAGAISAIGGCNCQDACEENIPYGFMYALLKKKAIDVCLACGHYDQACRYYIKFYKNNNCNCNKSCGCGNSDSDSNTSYTASSDVSITKNCGCHG